MISLPRPSLKPQGPAPGSDHWKISGLEHAIDEIGTASRTRDDTLRGERRGMTVTETVAKASPGSVAVLITNEVTISSTSHAQPGGLCYF